MDEIFISLPVAAAAYFTDRGEPQTHIVPTVGIKDGKFSREPYQALCVRTRNILDDLQLAKSAAAATCERCQQVFKRITKGGQE